MDRAEKKQFRKQRYALYCDLQMLCGGHPLHVVIAALSDSLACAVGISTESEKDADETLATLAGEMGKTIRENKSYLAEIRSQMVGAGHA